MRLMQLSGSVDTHTQSLRPWGSWSPHAQPTLNWPSQPSLSQTTPPAVLDWGPSKLWTTQALCGRTSPSSQSALRSWAKFRGSSMPFLTCLCNKILVVGKGLSGQVALHLQARCSHSCHWCRCTPAHLLSLIRSWPVREHALSATRAVLTVPLAPQHHRSHASLQCSGLCNQTSYRKTMHKLWASQHALQGRS